MANVPRPDGPWVDGADSITAAEANRWEANQQDASARLDALPFRPDNVTTTGAAVGGVLTVGQVSPLGLAIRPAVPDAARLIPGGALTNFSAATTGSVLAVLSGGRTVVRQTTSNKLRTSTDYGVTATAGHDFDDTTWTMEGVLETPSGELLVSVRKTGQTGKLYRSTGWNPATAEATSWSVVLNCSGTNAYFRREWGITPWGVAPAGSAHAGAIFLTEYGSQGVAVKTWMSTDDGASWTVILNLLTQFAALGETWFHGHGCCYDPWTGAVVVTGGDGGNANPGRTFILYSRNPQATTPTWTLVPGSYNNLGTDQVSAIAAIETGLIALPDGSPAGPKFIPRNADLSYGSLLTAGVYLTGAPNLIGGTLHRNGYNRTPSPGSPVLATRIEDTATGRSPVIIGTFDGLRWAKVYEHGTVSSNSAPGFTSAFGPTSDGKIVGTLNLSGTSNVFTATHSPPVII